MRTLWAAGSATTALTSRAGTSSPQSSTAPRSATSINGSTCSPIAPTSSSKRAAGRKGRRPSNVSSACAALRSHRGSGALAVLGLDRARRDEPGYQAPLDDAWSLAAPSGTGDMWRAWTIATARAEVAWLNGDREAMHAATDFLFPFFLERGWDWVAGELAYWRRSVDIDEPIPSGIAEPYALQLLQGSGRAQPSSGVSWASPTKPRLRSQTQTRRSRCGKRTRSCKSWARAAPPRLSRADYASAAHAACRADHVRRRRRTRRASRVESSKYSR